VPASGKLNTTALVGSDPHERHVAHVSGLVAHSEAAHCAGKLSTLQGRPLLEFICKNYMYSVVFQRPIWVKCGVSAWITFNRHSPFNKLLP
jgi:hypothetical protein